MARLNDTFLSYRERGFDTPRALLHANLTASEFPELVVLSDLHICVYASLGGDSRTESLQFSQSFDANRNSMFVTMTLVDVDKDGADDVVFVERTSDGSMSVSYLVNDGNGRFARLQNSRALPAGAFADQLEEDRSVLPLEVGGEEVLLLNAERWDRIEWLVRGARAGLCRLCREMPRGGAFVCVLSGDLRAFEAVNKSTNN